MSCNFLSDLRSFSSPRPSLYIRGTKLELVERLNFCSPLNEYRESKGAKVMELMHFFPTSKGVVNLVSKTLMACAVKT